MPSIVVVFVRSGEGERQASGTASGIEHAFAIAPAAEIEERFDQTAAPAPHDQLIPVGA